MARSIIVLFITIIAFCGCSSNTSYFFNKHRGVTQVVETSSEVYSVSSSEDKENVSSQYYLIDKKGSCEDVLQEYFQKNPDVESYASDSYTISEASSEKLDGIYFKVYLIESASGTGMSLAMFDKDEATGEYGLLEYCEGSFDVTEWDDDIFRGQWSGTTLPYADFINCQYGYVLNEDIDTVMIYYTNNNVEVYQLAVDQVTFLDVKDNDCFQVDKIEGYVDDELVFTF